MKSLARLYTFCIIGRSGAGKGTQARALLRAFGRGAHHMETGRFLRKIIFERDSPTTHLARRLLRRGKMFPSWLANHAWLRELVEGGHADRVLIFDGAPRTASQAKFIDTVLSWHGRPPAIGVYLRVSARAAAERLRTRGRADDTARSIKSRMAYFARDVLPAISYYRRRRRLLVLDGEQSPEGITQKMMAGLAKRFGIRIKR